jgi:polyferredoxin
MPFGIQQLPQLLGIIYALVLIPLVAYLWYSGKFSRKAGYLFLILTTLFGFLLFAPMAPWQLGLALEGRVQALPVPIYGVYAILGVLLVFTLVAGRIFCGHFCPIGTAQELAYLVPVRKVILRHKTITMAFRWAVFIVFVITALFLSNSILRLFGIHEFFHLNTASALFIVFVAILLVSIVVYRPFCRLFCPSERYSRLQQRAASSSSGKTGTPASNAVSVPRPVPRRRQTRTLRKPSAICADGVLRHAKRGIRSGSEERYDLWKAG